MIESFRLDEGSDHRYVRLHGELAVSPWKRRGGCFQLMRDPLDNEEYLRVSEIAGERSEESRARWGGVVNEAEPIVSLHQ